MSHGLSVILNPTVVTEHRAPLVLMYVSQCIIDRSMYVSFCSYVLLTGAWLNFTTQDRSTTSESPHAILKDQSSWWTIRYSIFRKHTVCLEKVFSSLADKSVSTPCAKRIHSFADSRTKHTKSHCDIRAKQKQDRSTKSPATSPTASQKVTSANSNRRVGKKIQSSELHCHKTPGNGKTDEENEQFNLKRNVEPSGMQDNEQEGFSTKRPTHKSITKQLIDSELNF